MSGDDGEPQVTHQRKIIRDKVVQLLLADSALAAVMVAMAPEGASRPIAERIVSTRHIEWKAEQMPAISVYCGRDSVDNKSKSSTARELERSMPLIIEVGALGATAQDKLDAISLHVERIMHADDTLGGACQTALLDNTDFEYSHDGERIIGVAVIQYSVDFITYAPYQADVTLDEFLQADVVYNLSNEQGEAEQAEDNFNVRGA